VAAFYPVAPLRLAIEDEGSDGAKERLRVVIVEIIHGMAAHHQRPAFWRSNAFPNSSMAVIARKHD
jgi:hypothetical protein